MQVKVKIINHSPYPLPAYASAGAAGLDLMAHIEENIILENLDRVLVPTGIFLEIPQGYEAQIRPRSGLALKKGLSIPNTPGTIDSDYRGEIKIILINLSKEKIILQPGERIAQLVLAKVERLVWEEVLVLEESQRAEGGFGSTGQ